MLLLVLQLICLSGGVLGCVGGRGGAVRRQLLVVDWWRWSPWDGELARASSTTMLLGRQRVPLVEECTAAIPLLLQDHPSGLLRSGSSAHHCCSGSRGWLL